MLGWLTGISITWSTRSNARSRKRSRAAFRRYVWILVKTGRQIIRLACQPKADDEDGPSFEQRRTSLTTNVAISAGSVANFEMLGNLGRLTAGVAMKISFRRVQAGDASWTRNDSSHDVGPYSSHCKAQRINLVHVALIREQRTEIPPPPPMQVFQCVIRWRWPPGQPVRSLFWRLTGPLRSGIKLIIANSS